MISRAVSVLGIVALLVTSGCSRVLWSTADGEPVGPTSMTTTQMSAATGAVVGAGLGTIIGASAGGVGQGLLIGTAAGTITGAAIGKYLEGQESPTATQEKAALTTHKQAVKEQEVEIRTKRQEERKRSSDVGEYSNNRSSVKPAAAIAQYRGNPNAQPVIASAAVSASRSRLASPSVSTPAVVTKTKSKPLQIAAKNLPSVKGHNDVTAKVAEEQATADSEAGAADEITAEELTVSPGTIHDETNPVLPSGLPAARKGPAPGEAAVQHAAEVTAPGAEDKLAAKRISAPAAETPDGCGKAGSEAKRGEQSTSASDKLFYYKRAARLCPTEASYVLKLGQVYAQLGRGDEAKKEFERVLSIDPDNATAHEELSLLEQDIGY